MNPDLIIFDLDGVLVESERIAIRIDSEMLTEAGFPMTPAEVTEAFLGLSDESMMADIQQRFGRPVPVELKQQMRDALLAAYPEELEATKGAAQLLTAIPGPRCVASSSDPDKIAYSLGLTGLERWFDAETMFSATMVERGKPAPDLFLHAASTMGHRPDRCLVIEDSPHGVSAAVAAGMPVIGYVGGDHAGPTLARRLNEAGADLVLDHHDAVAEAIGL